MARVGKLKEKTNTLRVTVRDEVLCDLLSLSMLNKVGPGNLCYVRLTPGPCPPPDHLRVNDSEELL